MLSFPTSKINIGLRIIGKRPDGYHDLESCFYPVGWGDVLEMVEADTFAFSSSGIPIPGDAQHNLCVRAYELLKTDHSLPPVHMHLHKLVPIGAGLGGGSADAAFVLKTLNSLFGLNLTADTLENYARKLGSDCAFFIQNRPLFAREKGDVFSEINLNLRGYHLVLVYPNLAISTAEAYTGVKPKQPETSLLNQLQAPMHTWRDRIHNDFEDNIFPRYPLLANLKQQLYDFGAVYASMSGSGSTMYGIFDAPIVLPNQFRSYNVWQGKL